MKEMTYQEAINEALVEEMERDPRVIIMGEDVSVGYGGGGVFGVTKGLRDKFGPERVIDTPLSESVIAGSAVGVALTGMRPIAEIMFADFFTIAMDQLVTNAAKMRWALDGKVDVPVVYRTAYGGGVAAGLHHSQSFEAWVAHVPGLKVLMPSTPADAKGMLKSAVRDNNPVVFLEHKFLYKRAKGPVPEGEVLVPIGKGDIKQEGKDLTIIALGAMVVRALEAAKVLGERGVSVEVVDPRSLQPLDEELILRSVEKTNRAVIVHEAPTFGGFGGEIAALLADKAIDFLDGPVKRVGAPFTPVPMLASMEQFYLPSVEKIVAAASATLRM